MIPAGLNGAEPNPFRGTTRIVYGLSESSPVRLTVFDVSGRAVQRLVTETQAAGEYEIVWDARALPAGVYFYRLEALGIDQTRRAVVIR